MFRGLDGWLGGHRKTKIDKKQKGPGPGAGLYAPLSLDCSSPIDDDSLAIVNEPRRGASFYRTLLENSFGGIAILNSEGVITFHNAAADATLGAQCGEVIGRKALDLVHPDDRSAAAEALAALAAQANTLLPDEIRMQRLDNGEYVHIELRAINLAAHPEICGILINFRDTTVEKGAMRALEESMRALEESERRLELALEGSGLGLWDWNIHTGTVAYDGRLAKILQIEPAELGDCFDDLRARLHPDEIPSFEDLLQAHLEGSARQFEHEHRLLSGDGSYRWVAARGMVVQQDNTGKPLRMVGTHLDIDERRRDAEERSRLEEQLQLAQKMESIGQLAGGIAHDFNNILQVILANASFASTSASDPERLKRCLREIEEAGQRAAQLTRQLLAFGRRQALSPSPYDINGLLRNTLQLLERLLPENICVDFIPGHRLATAFVDSGQFDQVITNLCVNARDAMPNGGRLTIETENVIINGEYRRKHPWARAGRYILVTVSDTGHGMDQEVQRRAFEPFFTTKNEGIGTGLGLAMVHGIVRQHDGLIHLYSEPGVGTTFKLYWPAVARPAATVGSKLEGAIPVGQETILVVEDEAAVRRLVTRILESAGYTVVSAGDGDEALELFFSRKEAFDLVLLDAVMPRRNGREVYEIISQHHPTPVLFTSGYSAASLPDDFLLRNQLEVLPKPYSPDLLLRKVREVIDRRNSAE